MPSTPKTYVGRGKHSFSIYLVGIVLMYFYCVLTIADFPPTENLFLAMILQANFSQDPLTNANRTSPHAPLGT